MSSLISALAWVPQGKSARYPTKYSLDSKELERVSALARVELDDAKLALMEAEGVAKGAKGIRMAEDGDMVDEGWETLVFIHPFAVVVLY